MANYEMMIIINPSLSEEERNTSIESLKAVLAKNSVTIDKEDVWGEKKMAYKIGKHSKGFYILLDLSFDWKAIKDISKEINLNEGLLRYMFVKKES